MCPSWGHRRDVTRTHLEVSTPGERPAPAWTPDSAADGIEAALAIVGGRWKLRILFHLFGGQVLRFSELARVLAGVSQKVLTEQLRQLEQDGVVRRIDHRGVPRRVEYGLTAWGQALCPALDEMLRWSTAREVPPPPGDPQRR